MHSSGMELFGLGATGLSSVKEGRTKQVKVKEDHTEGTLSSYLGLT